MPLIQGHIFCKTIKDEISKYLVRFFLILANSSFKYSILEIEHFMDQLNYTISR